MLKFPWVMRSQARYCLRSSFHEPKKKNDWEKITSYSTLPYHCEHVTECYTFFILFSFIFHQQLYSIFMLKVCSLFSSILFSKALALWSVIRYHHLLRAGVSWKINKTIAELWHSSSTDSEESDTTMSIYFDENENQLIYSNANKSSSNSSISRSYQTKVQWHDTVISKDDNEFDVDVRIDDEKILGDGSDEDDSLLVIYQDVNTKTAFVR